MKLGVLLASKMGWRVGSKWAVRCSSCVNTRRPNMTATTNNRLEIRPLDDKRYALSLDGHVRYVGTQEECERRAIILSQKNDRATQDKALARSVQVMR